MSQQPIVVPPVLQPLLGRTFITAVVGVLVSMLVVAVPQLQPFHDSINATIVVVVLALIGSDTAQTVSANNNAAKVAIAQAQASAQVQSEQLHLESVRVQAAASKAL